MGLSFDSCLPVSTPWNRTVDVSGTTYPLTYALAGNLARGTTVVEPGSGTPPSPDPTTPTPGACFPPAWRASAEYGGGSAASRTGHSWRAKWWTKGEEPGTTGEWGSGRTSAPADPGQDGPGGGDDGPCPPPGLTIPDLRAVPDPDKLEGVRRQPARPCSAAPRLSRRLLGPPGWRRALPGSARRPKGLNSMTTILVTGGTGTLGRHVTERLRADGHDVRVLSRHAQPYAVDLREGGGALDAAVAGADTVVHCASTPRGGDEEAAAHLTAAARRAGVGHLVYISIVGVDLVPFGYYTTKHAVERLVEESGLGWTVLRTTQFHDFLVRLFDSLARPPVMPLPAGVRDQPIEVAEVAARLAELAAGGPPGGSRTWAGRRCAPSSRWPARTSGPRAAGGRSCGYRCGGARTGPSAPVGTSRRSTRWARAPSRSTWRCTSAATGRELPARGREQLVLGPVPRGQQRPAQYGGAAQGTGPHLRDQR
ncbi:hypothetical protein GCM10020295_69290 [Streptomyces cinereospinus]